MYQASDLLAPRLLATYRRVLWLPLAAGYVAAHGLLYGDLAQSLEAGAAAAVSMTTIRLALGGDYWGMPDPSGIGLRTLGAVLTPLLFLLPGWWPLVALLHPTTLYRLLVPGRNDGDPEVARRAILWRFAYLFYPLERRTLVSVAAHVALPLAVWLAVGAPLAWLALAIVLVTFGGTGLVQVLSRATRRPPLDVQCLRTFRLLYPVLGVGFALAYATWPLSLSVPLFLLSLVSVSWLKGWVRVAEPAPWYGTTEEDGRRWKAGALAYLQGTGAMVRWYQEVTR